MPRALKKWIKRLAISVAVIFFGGWLGGALALRHWTAKPPPLPVDSFILQAKTQVHDGKLWLGKSWFGQREGLPVVFLKGSPLEMGFAHGTLLREQMHTLENEFLVMIQGYVPQHWKVEVLKWYIIYRNRNLNDFVPADYRMEIYGASVGCGDNHPEEGDFYNRLFNYHAAHDVSYMMIDNPLISRAGCTSFGAWGADTMNRHLISGRNFDWEAAEVFSRDRVVIMCEPDGGIPFVSLSWAGMAGVVSGMNRAGVSVTLNGAPSSLPSQTATPVAIVARDMMQHAHNLNEALQILRKARVFVSTLWLIGSRADGKFVVVEKTPDVMHLREPVGDSIVCANHFETADLKDAASNTNYLAEATSRSREMRLNELIDQSRGHIDPKRAVEFLRDRNLPGGVFAGNGHRGSLNALIATHAVVMDLTDGIFWASAPPHQLGRFIAFDVNDFNHEIPEVTVPSDMMLKSGEFHHAQSARNSLVEGEKALRKKVPETALKLAQDAEQSNPGFYQNFSLAGRALLAMGKRTEAAHQFERALAAKPAFLKERKELERLLKEAKQ